MQVANDTQLLIPEKDCENPELSIVIPALNEEITIGTFVDWCHQGLEKAGVAGEILIVDSSADRTAEIALECGARVLKTPKRGLGRAYIDAIPHIRGRYVLMGDADCTYDFRELGSFVEKFHEGYEFIMGSRFRGYIEPGAMPWLHRYLGTPVTTWILNILYSSRFSDIHCGMRGMTLDALKRMKLKSQAWEYASEIVLKSVHMDLRTAEVPVRFLKDMKGRVSHHRREGWFSPWYAAWINLRAMFIYGADFFLFKPGLVLLVVGLALVAALSLGPIEIGPFGLSLNWMLIGLVTAVLGMHGVFVGGFMRMAYDYSRASEKHWLKLFPYTRTAILCGLSVGAGLVLFGRFVLEYFRTGMVITPEMLALNHQGVAGVFLIVVGFMTFTFMLSLHGLAIYLNHDNGQ